MTTNTNSPIEQEYIDALNRLVERKSPISLNKVAKEAGKKEGSLRKERYPFVCQEVQRAIEVIKADKPRKKKAYKTENEASDSLRQQLTELKHDYAVALQKIISLENQLFETRSRSNVASIKPRV